MIILKRLIKDFLSIFVFLRFKDIWSLYQYLLDKNKRSGICASVFCHYVDCQSGYIGIGAKFGNRPHFPHGLHGVFISQHSEIGKNAVILHGVTIGANLTRGSRNQGYPKIGDNCFIGAGAKIIGGITIGNNCRIGANAVVYSDMQDNSVAVCAPTRIIQKEEPMDNHFLYMNENRDLLYWDGNQFKKEE